MQNKYRCVVQIIIIGFFFFSLFNLFTQSQMSITSEPLVHRFDIALKAVEKVQNGDAPFYTQYLLKPDLNIKEDIKTAAILFFIICIVRLLVSGLHRKSWKNFPCLARLLFQKFVIPNKSLKFYENFWYTCWHICSFLFGLYILSSEAMTEKNPGWTRMLVRNFDSKWFWFPTPAEIVIKQSSGWPFLIMSPLVRLYYIMEFSFWTSCAIFLWFETYRSDFYALLLHHGITSALLLASYTLSFWRIGCVILMTHDVADIFLYFVKCLFYMTKFAYLITPIFLLFTPAFDTRLWTDWTQRLVTSHWQIPGGLMLPACLSILQVLHIFWFALIIKVALRLQNKNEKTKDIRSDDDDEDTELHTCDTANVSMSQKNKSCVGVCHKPTQLSSLPGVRAPVYDTDCTHSSQEEVSTRVTKKNNYHQE